MAAELVGGAILSSFLNVLFDRLSDPAIINMIRGKKVDQKLLQQLENVLTVVEAVLNDAEKKQITDSAVKRWLENLQDAVYDADDLLDEVATKAATQKDSQGNILCCFFNLQDRKMVTRIEDVITRLENIAKDKDILRLEKIAAKNMSGRLPSTSIVKKSDIFVGRDKDKDTIVNLLLDDANSGDLSVIPIVGMGGIGKTTLAKLVYNDDEVQQKFLVKVWVCDGEEEFDVLKVTKAVIEKSCSTPCNSNDLDKAQNHLKNALGGKNFLVVLDDVWSGNREAWESFLTPFECGSQGGKFLVTTRLDTVASMVKTRHNQAHNLSLLDGGQCWSVFANRAWGPAESPSGSALEKNGRKIVEKCKGLPLAAQTLGGLLQGKDDENVWNDVLNSDIWKFPDEKCGILPALRISYYHLPSYLKRCFVYCSLYPKDYEFHRDELVLLWMAEGFLQQPKAGSTLEEVGCEYFNDLASRSFFQPSNDADSFVMHDLMHDLATFYGEKFYFRTFEVKNVLKHDTKTRHLSYVHNKDSISKILEVCDSLKHARTLLKTDLYTDYVSKGIIDPCHLLKQVKCLRVLSFKFFSHNKERLLHDSIGKLIHLRYLDLSGAPVKTLPKSLGNLYNLQTLKLRNCAHLKKLPTNMQNLVNLRHLDTLRTPLEEMPKGMSKLQDLQYLSDYMVGKHEENGVGELGELAHLHGTLRIQKLENVENSGEASNARMDEKVHLDALYLRWSSFEESEVCDSQTEKDVLDKLHPHENLKALRIFGYRGTMFPEWVGQSSYHNMTELLLVGCKNCWVVPSLGQLPSLMELSLEGFDMVKKIGAEFYKADGTHHHHQETPFRSLKTLSFNNMGCWEEWESFECGDDDDVPFPQLETLSILKCPKLRGDLPTFLPSLKLLRIQQCSELGCDLPRAPIIRDLRIEGKQEARMRELSLSMLETLRVNGDHLVEYAFDSMTHTQPTSLSVLHISNCSSVVSFAGDSLPPSLRELYISDCKNVEFPMQHQQHHLLKRLEMHNSCDSLTSFPFPAFPNLIDLTISRRENLTSLEEVSKLQSLRELYIYECPKLQSIRVPASLRELWIRECPLLGEGIERKDPHIWPSISHIPKIYVDEKLICNESAS